MAWTSAGSLPYLKTSGGTMNGYIYMDNSNLDLSGSASANGNARLYFRDKNDVGIAEVFAGVDSSGRVFGRIEAFYDGVYNTLNLLVAKDGTRSYSVNDPVRFRQDCCRTKTGTDAPPQSDSSGTIYIRY